MSTTATKRRHAEALADAQALRALFPDGTHTAWQVAGSIRRRCAYVGDVEHVVRATYGGGLFGGAEGDNLVFERLDQLVADGVVTKHVYPHGKTCWGDRQRGVDFNGFRHEFFAADLDNWGAQLAIRTGPEDFSRAMVTNLRRFSRRNIDGYVWECRPCPLCGFHATGLCTVCDGTGLEPKTRLSVGDERAYFSLCGMDWIEPEER